MNLLNAHFIKKPQHQTGFTLIELISVIVIVSILAAFGSQFVVSTMHTYQDVEQRSKIINRGRLVLEQMSRQLRIALPNAIRVSASGNCIEFLPIVAGASYLSDVPDDENLAPGVSSIATAPFSFNSGDTIHAVVGGMSPAEVFSTGSPNSRVSINSVANTLPTPTINFSSSHQFLRNSIRRRVFLTDDPIRFCLIGTTLYQYSNYGLSTSALVDVDPGGDADIMAENVQTPGVAFLLSLSTEDYNSLVRVDLTFSRGDSSINLQHEVYIRNVP